MLALIAVLSGASLSAQSADSLAPALAELPLRRVGDSRCLLSRFAAASDPTPGAARGLLAGLFGERSTSGADRKTYDWILWLPVTGKVDPADTLAARVYDAAGGRFVTRDKLYEAGVLRLVVLLPLGTRPESGPAYTVRAGAAVRKETSLLAAGFPAFLSEILGGLLSREAAPGCAPPFASYDVAVLVTQLGTPDATVAARAEVDVSPPLEPERAGLALDGFRKRRVDVEAEWLGYTALGKIFDAIEAALAGPACASGAADDCLRAARAAAVETAEGLGLTAEHAITAIRTGTEEALTVVEELLAARRFAAERTFRVVDRPLIGFSVGGILAEGSGEDLKFKVEDGRVVAEGVEGEGFKALALVDLYFRRVDIGESAPGLVPHASVGFTIGEVFRPGVFLATTLPFTAGRLALFGGGVLRRETTSDVPSGSEVEPGTEPIRERYRFPLVAGLKVGLPF